MNVVDEIIENIVNHWTPDQFAIFLLNQMSIMSFKIDARNSSGWSALGHFVQCKLKLSSRDKQIINLLLQHGADPLQRCGPLDAAAVLSAYTQVFEEADVVILLLEYVANINIVFPLLDLQVHTRVAPIHLGVLFNLPDVVRYVLSRNADLELKRDGKTVLHLVTEIENSSEVAKLLLDHGANLETRDLIGKTPLFSAIDKNRQDLVELFVAHGSDLNAKDLTGKTPILSAVRLLRVEMVKYLHEMGADLNARNPSRSTCLHILFDQKETEGAMDLCQYLLSSGCDPNALNDMSNTPLHRLIGSRMFYNKMKFAKLMIKYGAGLNHKNVGGYSLIHLAILRSDAEKHIPTIIFLIKHGAEPSILNKNGDTCLHPNATCAFKIIKELVVEERAHGYRFSNEFQRMISSDERLSDQQMLCRREIDVLTEKRIHEDLSLFKLFINDDRKIAESCWNMSIRNSLVMFEATEFPIYGRDILKKIDQGMKLHPPLYGCKDILLSVTGINFYLLEDVMDCIPNEYFKLILKKFKKKSKRKSKKKK